MKEVGGIVISKVAKIIKFIFSFFLLRHMETHAYSQALYSAKVCCVCVYMFIEEESERERKGFREKESELECKRDKGKNENFFTDG